jgi:ABC-2 type transport system ATP-binding protein
VRRLDDAGIALDDLALRRPTLDDVFLALTGKAAESPDAAESADAAGTAAAGDGGNAAAPGPG